MEICEYVLVPFLCDYYCFPLCNSILRNNNKAENIVRWQPEDWNTAKSCMNKSLTLKNINLMPTAVGLEYVLKSGLCGLPMLSYQQHTVQLNKKQGEFFFMRRLHTVRNWRSHWDSRNKMSKTCSGLDEPRTFVQILTKLMPLSFTSGLVSDSNRSEEKKWGNYDVQSLCNGSAFSNDWISVSLFPKCASVCVSLFSNSPNSNSKWK